MNIKDTVKENIAYSKELLEAGSDVKAVFDCIPDGSAAIRIARIAYAQVQGDTLILQERGQISGFMG